MGEGAPSPNVHVEMPAMPSPTGGEGATTAAAFAERRLAARALVGGCPLVSQQASRCQGIYSVCPADETGDGNTRCRFRFWSTADIAGHTAGNVPVGNDP
jgi:hypothetical protein